MKGLQESVKEVEFTLSISADDYLSYYRGQTKWVLVNSYCGKKVKFPANLLASHVTRSGITGRFVLRSLSSGKAVVLCKITPYCCTAVFQFAWKLLIYMIEKNVKKQLKDKT